MADAHKNFAYSTVATAPSPATSGTSLVVAAAEGARFPDTPFNATIWPATGVATPANAEVVRVTARSTDTLTITRAQEGSSARSVVVGDRIIASITDRTLTDAEQSVEISVTQSSHGFAVGDVLRYTGSTYAKAQADSDANAEVVGIVSASVTSNVFRMVLGGRVSGLSGLTAGTVYFLSATTAGALTATEPALTGHVSKPLLIADATTTGYFVNWRGAVVSGATASVLLKQKPLVPGSSPDMDVDPQFPDGVSATLYHYVTVPSDYVSGDITVKYFVRGLATQANTAVMRRNLYRFRDGVAYGTIESSTNINQTGWTLDVDVLKTFTIGASNFQEGDIIRFDLIRLGGDGSDNYTSSVVFDGGWFEYYGESDGAASAIVGEDGWTIEDSAWTYASATTFTVPGDQTTRFSKGTRIRLTQTTVKYFVVTASSHSSGTTTVTVTGGSDYSLANAAITSPSYSYAANPQGYPTWFNYTPTWTSTGTAPAIGNGNIVGRFAVTGKILHCTIEATFGSTSTYGTGDWRMSAPVNLAAVGAQGFSGAGAVWAVDQGTAFRMGTAMADSNNEVFRFFRDYDVVASEFTATIPHTWATNDVLTCTVTCEI